MKFPSYHVGLDVEKCTDLKSWIDEQTPVMEEASKIAHYEALQVREKEDEAQINKLASAIDGTVTKFGVPKEQGDTASLNLKVVLFEDVGIGGGNHTLRGCILSVYGRKVPLVTVPSERIKGFNETELRWVGYRLNSPESVVDYLRNSNDDLKKACRDFHEKAGIEIYSDEMLTALMGLNITSQHAEKIISATNTQVERDRYNKENMVGKKYINHDTKKNKKKYADMIEELKSDGKTLAYTITSGSRGAIQSLLMKVMVDHHDDIEKLVVLVKHSKCHWELEWKTKRLDERNMLNWAMDGRDVETQYVTLPYVQSDTSKINEEI
tara:strand:+ start:139 stop:1110 length:972 start_codon:yes stop_codon:yes gene_type:complete